MGNLSTNQEHKPLLVSRRSELIAWLLTSCLFFVLLFASVEGRAKVGGVILLVFLTLSALTMSIGNWIDRSTYLRISEQGVSYFNGSREVSIAWQEIKRVEIYPGKIGDKITVSSSDASFRFQALGEIKMSEKVSGQVGFKQGDQILETIMEQSGLTGAILRKADGYDYYSRE